MTVSNFDDESNLLDIDREPETNKRLPRWAVIVIVLVLTATACFGLGILADQSVNSYEASAGGGSSLSVGGTANGSSKTSQIIGDSTTHMFYLPWCSQASSISEANTVWFGSEQVAEDKGYTAGKDCAGL